MLGEGYVVQDWGDQNRSLFDALWLEKMAISLTIFLIVMVAALNIVASLILLVMEKHRDIAILKTMGASARSVTAVFMTQGLIIGIIGTIGGRGGGIRDRRRVESLPDHPHSWRRVSDYVRAVQILPFDFAMVIAAAVLICFVATIYPSRQAARLDPGAGAAIRITWSRRHEGHEDTKIFWPKPSWSSCLRASCNDDVRFSKRAGSSNATRSVETTLNVLRDLDLTVEAGEMVAIMGASGVGKSTLLHILGGLDRANQGDVTVAATNLTSLPDADVVAFRNRHVGFVFQFHHLLPEFSAVENVEMPMRIARIPVAEARPRAEELLQRVGLAERTSHRPGMLSGGEQQRVAVARALIMRPALLLADEPTGDLDEKTAESLHRLLRDMHGAYGLTSVIATHNPRLAEACDRVLRLEGGRLTTA